MRLSLSHSIIRTWIPAIVLVAVATCLAYYFQERFADSIQRQFLEEEMGSVRDAAGGIESRLQVVAEDLAFLSDIPELRDLVAAVDEVERHLANVRYAFLSFCFNRKLYYQAIYANEKGKELVRVERRGDRVLIVPEDELEDDSAAAFFKGAKNLPRGDLYVSPLELEAGDEFFEAPPRPVVRFATPIYDDLDNKRGVVLFTLDAEHLLRQLAVSRLWLINEKGEFFAHPDRRALYTQAPNRFAEREWSGVQMGSAGQTELVAYTNVNVGPGNTWKLGKTSPYSVIRQPIRKIALYTWGIYASVLVIFAVVGFQLRRVEKRRILIEEEMKYVSRRLELERRLRDADARYRDLVENSPEMIYQVDKERRFVSVNSTGLDRLGYSFAEMQAMRLEDIVPERFRADVVRHIERVVETGHSRLETVFLTKNGEEVQVDIDASAMYDVLSGEFVSTRAFARDVTEKRRLERQLLQSEKLATVGQLAAGIAHEIGTPLNVILGNAEYLMMQLPADAPARKELGVMVAETERVSRLIGQLLEFSRPSRLDLKLVNINEVVEEALALANTQIEKGKVSVAKELEASLPPIRGDRNQLHQLFLNIVMNAIQAMPQGGTLTVATGLIREPSEYLTEPQDFVEIAFADTGCGIPAENIGKIFDPFFSTKDPGQGTGLGLAVCARIVQLHNGALDARSQVGRGSTFIVKLPIEGNV
jgi:PAS domain S-box-containing protein